MTSLVKSMSKSFYLILDSQSIKSHVYAQGTLTEGERLSTINLLVLTSLDLVLFILKILFTFVT
jgi:hypothetical protein